MKAKRPKKAVVIFKELFQHSQVLGSDDEHMISTITFDVIVGGAIVKELRTVATGGCRVYSNATVTIKQTVGSKFGDSIEMSAPDNYKGPALDHETLRQQAEKCFATCVGSTAVGIRLVNCTNTTMKNNRFGLGHFEPFEIKLPSN